jgi:integrase
VLVEEVAGIEVRHARDSPAPAGKCSCQPTYRAWAFDRRANGGKGGKVRRSFPTLSAAKQWRADAIGEVRRGKLRAAPTPTLRDAAAAWLAGVHEGSIRNRSGDPYKPGTVREYARSLGSRILPELGGRRVNEVSHDDLQDLADRLLAEGLDPSSVRNTLMPLRAIFRRLAGRSDSGVTINPTTGLELPAVRGRRERIAAPTEATQLLEALPVEDRALWATAMYGGLRRGELMALRIEDVDLAAGVIRVERSWDVKEGPVEPKSQAGRRSVPIPAVLRDYLIGRKLRLGRNAGLFFGRSEGLPFASSAVSKRAGRAWRTSELDPIGLHECRHTFVSLMIAAGVNPKALSTFMGHSSITITLDRYGHLFPGSEDEAAALLDAYLERANTAARLVQLA